MRDECRESLWITFYIDICPLRSQKHDVVVLLLLLTNASYGGDIMVWLFVASIDICPLRMQKHDVVVLLFLLIYAPYGSRNMMWLYCCSFWHLPPTEAKLWCGNNLVAIDICLLRRRNYVVFFIYDSIDKCHLRRQKYDVVIMVLLLTYAPYGGKNMMW